MSVENFCAKYPISPDLTQILEREKRSEDMSLIAVLAVNLVKESGNGVRALITKYGSSNTMFALDEESMRGIPQEDTKEMLKCLAGIIFGVTVVSLERTIVNKRFDFTDWCERYNLAISGTQLASVKAKEETEVLLDLQWREMISLAKQDKTFAIFFEEKHRNLMPQALNRFFGNLRIMPTIRADIIPIYKERAKLLVDKS